MLHLLSINMPFFSLCRPGRVCALCCLGEQSQLGQGDLVRHHPTPGYTLPEKIVAPPEDIDGNSNSQQQHESPLTKKLKTGHAGLK